MKFKERLAVTGRGYRMLGKYCPGLIRAKVLSALAETLSPFVTIWFSAGIINEIAGNRDTVRLVLLVLLRPLARKLSVKQKDQMVSGAKAMIGKQAIVTEEIDSVHAKGAVQVNGQYWTAKTKLFEDKIPKDTIVDIIDVDGVKLIVRPAENKQ